MSPTIKDFEELARSVDGHGPADRVPLVRRRARRRAQAKAAGSALAIVLVAGGIGTALDLGGTFRAAPPAQTATTAPTVTASPDPTATAPVTPPATALPTLTAPASVEPFADVRWKSRTYPMQCPGGQTEVVVTDGTGRCGDGDVTLASRDIVLDGAPYRLVILTGQAADGDYDVVHVYAPDGAGGARLAGTPVTLVDRLLALRWDGSGLVGESLPDATPATVALTVDGDRVTGRVTRTELPLYTLDLTPRTTGGSTVTLGLDTGGTAWPMLMTDGRVLEGDVYFFVVEWGDGTNYSEGESEGIERCMTERAPEQLTPHSLSFDHTYPTPGTYTISVRLSTCSRNATDSPTRASDEIVRTTDVVVP